MTTLILTFAGLLVLSAIAVRLDRRAARKSRERMARRDRREAGALAFDRRWDEFRTEMKKHREKVGR